MRLGVSPGGKRPVGLTSACGSKPTKIFTAFVALCAPGLVQDGNRGVVGHGGKVRGDKDLQRDLT
eukprot:11170494-Lingulodinium_polyedra.AAC.1